MRYGFFVNYRFDFIASYNLTKTCGMSSFVILLPLAKKVGGWGVEEILKLM